MRLEETKVQSKPAPSLLTSFLAGAAAGLVVDVALFPLDTLKTRLQSPSGFWKSGGFRGTYQGIGPVIIASAPTAAVFFVTYDGFKGLFAPHVNNFQQPIVHIAAASIAEVVSCIVRVPSEVVKQRRQACINEISAIQIVQLTLKRHGIRGMYQGYLTTILRDIPYAAIQFSLWEFFKKELRETSGQPVTPAQGALCGAFAGMISGAVTTPLDVVKTRHMLYEGSKKKKPPSFRKIAKWLYQDRGLTGFFSGFVPRVAWIFLGGGIFFGVYEETSALLEKYSGR